MDPPGPSSNVIPAPAQTELIFALCVNCLLTLRFLVSFLIEHFQQTSAFKTHKVRATTSFRGPSCAAAVRQLFRLCSIPHSSIPTLSPPSPLSSCHQSLCLCYLLLLLPAVFHPQLAPSVTVFDHLLTVEVFLVLLSKGLPPAHLLIWI